LKTEVSAGRLSMKWPVLGSRTAEGTRYIVYCVLTWTIVTDGMWQVTQVGSMVDQYGLAVSCLTVWNSLPPAVQVLDSSLVVFKHCGLV